MSKQRGMLIALIAIGLIVLTAFGSILKFITDYLWFKELGYTGVFLTKLMTQVKIAIPMFIIFTLILFFYLRSIKNDYYKKVNSNSLGISEKRMNQITLGVSVLVSLLSVLAVTSAIWYDILKAFNGTDFNILDPIFFKDISFYIFQLPLMAKIYSMLVTFVLFLIIATIVFYLFLIGARRPSIREVGEDQGYRRGGLFGNYIPNIDTVNIKEVLNVGVKQLSILGVIFFLVLGSGYILKQFELLYSSRGIAFGASYADIKVTLWLYRAMMVFSFISAITFAIGLRSKKLKTAFIGPVLLIVISIAGNGIALGVQNFIVVPDEISKESEYLGYNIEYTQLAYNLDQVEEKEFPANLNLTREDLDINKETIDNIRINDYRPTNQFYNQRQSMRRYYRFNDIDIDRYIINGAYTQVFLSAREIDENLINDQWISQHLKYTHGYGVALSPVNAITATGQPQLLIQNIPPISSIPEIQIERPELYFGELTNNYIVINTDEEEFDYPSGDDNVYTFYEGTGGIPLKGLNRILFAIREQSFKILISSNITSESKIIINRNIMDRVQTIAPFISYDEDPYVVVSEGKLYWIVDGYTTSNYYPYAQPFDSYRTNYIRNPIKVVIDAYNGTVDYYIVEEEPMAMTLSKIFPELFKSLDEMPEGLRRHLRYPEQLFNIQAFMYRDYHMTNTSVFYMKEDRWDISRETYGNAVTQMEPHYFIMKLPGEEREEFILSIPYTPTNRENLTALFIARNDGEDYGKLVVYKMPKEKAVYGPMQVEARITQDSEIAKELALWGQRGSTVIRGNILTIPIEESLIYVEPIYLQADNTSGLPEVRRVIVAYGDMIAYQPTLDKALEELFGDEDTASPSPDIERPGSGEDMSLDELINLANEAYMNMEEAQRNGNWTAYGQYLNQLESYLEALQELYTIQ
ncbi:MAG: UPF0182 family protein [Peptostreptococcales bacterium]